jgi:hypothetical protein
MRPNSETPMHSHPGISAISLYLTGNMDFSREEGVFSDLSQYQKANKIGYHQLIGQHIESIEGTAHAVRTHKEGGAFLIFEHWHDEDPSSVAVAWEGELVGKQHEQTIKAHNEVE